MRVAFEPEDLGKGAFEDSGRDLVSLAVAAGVGVSQRWFHRPVWEWIRVTGRFHDLAAGKALGLEPSFLQVVDSYVRLSGPEA